MSDDSGSDHGAVDRSTVAVTTSRFRRRLWRIGSLLWSVALLVGGITAGWAAHERYAPEPEAIDILVDINRPVVAEAGGRFAVGTVPNVLGLTEEQARQVMIDAGLDSTSVAVERIPAAGDSERIVNQQPVAGSVLGGAVTIFVGEPTTMPTLADLPIAVARQVLTELGARPAITTRFDPTVSEGTVLETFPAAGQPLPIDVSLVIAEPATSVFLTQLDALQRDCSVSSVTANGSDYDDAFICSPTFDRIQTMEFAVARAATELTAVIAHDDAGEIGSTAVFGVYVDGVLAEQWVVPFGTETAIAVDLTNALRVRLDVQRVGIPDEQGDVRAVWADVRLLGGRTNIEGLLDGS